MTTTASDVAEGNDLMLQARASNTPSCTFHQFDLGQRWYGDNARAKTAQLLDPFGHGEHGKADDIRALFNYDRSGKTLTQFPAVKFMSTARGFALVGFGDAGEQIIRATSDLIAHQFCQDQGVAVRRQHRTLLCGATLLPYDTQYKVGRMVVQKDVWHRQYLQESPERANRHVRDLILRGIRTQAEFLGIELPSPDRIKVEVSGHERVSGVPLGHGGANLDAWHGVTINTNLYLSGFWSVGYLTARGYGLFNADMQNGMGLE